MRLLDTTSFVLQTGEQATFRQEGYAILSHRWVGLEVTFEQLKGHEAELRTGRRPLSSPQVDKIRGACETARNQGLRWMWIDTCCINKASATEEAESINSMFKWYRDARLCITYLHDVVKTAAATSAGPDTFRRIDGDEPSEWFSRGWTLQELLAPRQMQFYDTNWTYMGTKTDMADALQRITRIDARYLTGAKHFGEACIAAKMSWMAGRTTGREEDMAYSMIGIFNITMTPQYGEGMRAFARLQRELLSAHAMDESLFAWKMPAPDAGARYNVRMAIWGPEEWGLLAPSPDWFWDSADVVTFPERQGPRAFSTTPQGLRAPIGRLIYTGKARVVHSFAIWTWPLIIPGVALYLWVRQILKKRANEDFAFKLNCYKPDVARKRYTQVEIYLRPSPVTDIHIREVMAVPQSPTCKRVRCTEFGQNSEIIKYGGEGIVLQPEPGYPD